MKRVVASVCLSVVLVGCSDGGPGGDPAAQVGRVERGFHAPVGVAVGNENLAYWVRDVMAGWSEPTENERPGSIKNIKSISGCDFTKPAADDFVAKVMVDTAVAKTPIFASSLAAINDAAKSYVEDVKKNGTGALVPDTSAADQLGLVDVVVTDTSKPIYLVLAHTSGMIFNIHAQDGVKISHIALLGSGPDGVVNAGAIPVESLNANQMKDCKVLPMRPPANYWTLVKDSAEKPELQQEVALNKKQAEQFSAWFTKNFGVDSESGVYGVAETSHVLVGPVPLDTSLRTKYNALDGATVYMTPRDVLFTGSAETYAEKKKSLIVQQATASVGGDLSKLAQQQ